MHLTEILVRTEESESRLVQEAVKRDTVAFARLYERCVRQVYRHVCYRVSDRVDAEDITQETFVRAWKGIDRYKDTGTPFAAWLIAIASNLVTDHYRRRAKTVITDELDDSATEQGKDPEGIAEANFQSTTIKKAVLKLKGDKQRVILMRFIDGFSHSEIARALHKSEGAVRVIQFRALQDLRHLLRQEQIEKGRDTHQEHR